MSILKKYCIFTTSVLNIVSWLSRGFLLVLHIFSAVQVEPYVMLRHSPLLAAATAGSNSSSSSRSRSINNIASSSSSSSLASSVRPVQHHLDRASVHFEGFIVDLMDRITNVRKSVHTVLICQNSTAL